MGFIPESVRVMGALVITQWLARRGEVSTDLTTRHNLRLTHQGAAPMGFIPESVRVMGARASESGLGTWERAKDKYVEVAAIVREDLRRCWLAPIGEYDCARTCEAGSSASRC